jgi:ABC-type phosphate/phosphonate transport system substrate-binding protein
MPSGRRVRHSNPLVLRAFGYAWASGRTVGLQRRPRPGGIDAPMRNLPRKPWPPLGAALLCLLGAARAAATDAPLVLLVQPVLSEEQTRRQYGPLAEYLGRAAGRPGVVATAPNFLAYWARVRADTGHDLVFDAAHFTDYRLQKLRYRLLAQVPDTVTYSLVVPASRPVTDPLELAGKTVATLGPPSIAAARLNAMFPNPARQPTIVEIGNADEGLQLVLGARVHAALLPTALVRAHLARAGGIRAVTTTEPIPHALSVSPRVEARLREQLRAALLKAGDTPEGRSMLAAAGVERFEPADAAAYAGQSRALREYWGY